MVSLTDILTTVQQGVIAVNNLVTQTSGSFNNISSQLATLTANGSTKLTAPRTYYVSTSGSDSNTGLASTSAFLTPQHAISVAAGLDSNGFDVTLQLSGNYSLVSGLTGQAMKGSGHIIILGDETTPSNVTLTCSAANAIGLNNSYVSTVYEVRGVNWVATGGGTTFALQAQGCLIRHQNMQIDAGWLQQLRAIDAGTIATTGSTLIISASPLAGGYCIVTVAGVVRFTPVTNSISIPSALSFTAGGSFVAANTTGAVIATAGILSITGAGAGAGSSGQRYQADTNGVIRTDGGGAAFFPGNVAGSTTNGGVYT